MPSSRSWASAMTDAALSTTLVPRPDAALERA
jgi:hypothetical protein